jgi:uncharacterized membrane protein YqjE
VRALSLLPRAAPVLLRHLGAYAELAAQELARTRASMAARAGGYLLVAVGLAGAAAMGCVAIIAANWDTPQRMAAIYALLAFFLGLAAAAAAYGRRLRATQPPVFGQLRREWRLDQVIVGRMLSGGGAHGPEPAPEADERQ